MQNESLSVHFVGEGLVPPADPCQVNGRIVMRPYPMKCHTLIFVPCYPQQNVECW